MSGKIFGVTWGLIFLVIIVAVIARKWGDKIPLLSKL